MTIRATRVSFSSLWVLQQANLLPAKLSSQPITVSAQRAVPLGPVTAGPDKLWTFLWFWQPDWSVWPIRLLQWISAGWAPTRKSLRRDFQSHLYFCSHVGHVRNKTCLSLKWPIYGCRLKERLPGLASATHLLLLLLLPPLLLLSVSQRSDGSGSWYLSVAQICSKCHTGQPAFQAPQRWIKSCVKLPLWWKWINKFEGLIPWLCTVSWVWLHNASLNAPSALCSALCVLSVC